MAYFPAFLNIDDKKIIIIGGGYIACEKLMHLLDFTTNIALIAEDFSEEIKSLIDTNNLHFIQKEYEVGDIAEFDIIIVAIDNINLQKEIYAESKSQNCLCNCVDVPECCDFIFPAYVKKDNLIIAVSTSGTSPAMAKYIKQFLNHLIPDSVVDFLNEMKTLRTTMPKGKNRMMFLDKKAKNYINTWKKNVKK